MRLMWCVSYNGYIRGLSQQIKHQNAVLLTFCEGNHQQCEKCFRLMSSPWDTLLMHTTPIWDSFHLAAQQLNSDYLE